MNFNLKSIPLTMLAMALCLSLPACGGDDDDDDPPPEGADASVIVTDGGSVTDGGIEADSGTVITDDGGTTDAGTVISDGGVDDAGTEEDAGTVKVSEGDPCDESFKDVCQDGNVFFCKEGQVAMEDCVHKNYACHVSESGVGRCREKCPLDSFGTCDGNAAVFCDKDGFMLERSCNKHGGYCAVDSFGGAHCIGGAMTNDACGDVTAEGECAGNTVKYCVNGEMVVWNCADSGMVCRNGENGYDCFFDWEGKPCSDYGLQVHSGVVESTCIDSLVGSCYDGFMSWSATCGGETDCFSQTLSYTEDGTESYIKMSHCEML